MKVPSIAAFLGLLCIVPASAQANFPVNPGATPKNFKTRAVGSGVNAGVSVVPAKPADPDVRYVTHVVLYPSRYWTNTEGKPLEAKLIAFEDLVALKPQGAAEPVMPTPPANPTLIRGGKVRLLVNQKPVEIALDTLSRQDREFIDQIKAALDKKAAGK